MLTPPYHFSIVASPLALPDDGIATEILYRGSIPASRNLPFLRRLSLKTILVLSKKQLRGGDVLLRWAEKHGVDVRWIKAEEMGEENLGMGRVEVGEVLKIILDCATYPLYIADVDGISHTTLVVACLRKLQGWHMDSIIDEIFRFEPEHEDLPLVPFVSSYLSAGPSFEALVLPPAPYPSWLWPSPAGPHAALSRTSTNTNTNSLPREKELSQRDLDQRGERDRDQRERDRTTPTSYSSMLPFPYPPSSRKHPTMRLAFPPGQLQTPPLPLSRVSSRRDKVPSTSPASAISPSQVLVSPSNETGGSSLMGAAAHLLSAGLAGVMGAVGGTEGLGIAGTEEVKDVRAVNFSDNGVASLPGVSSGSTSPEKLSRVTTLSSAPIRSAGDKDHLAPEDEEEGEENDYEEDEDEYEEDDDEEDEELQPTSLHISALDLAGYG